MNKLDELGIDGFCAMLVAGKSRAQISREIGVSPASVVEWLAKDPEYSARAREASLESADAYADMAEDILAALPPDASQAQITQARELAHHYRWMAAKRRPQTYSERVQQDVNTKVEVTLSDEELNDRIADLARKAGIVPPA